MTREFFALSFGFVVLAAAPGLARAQSACADHGTVVQRLAEGYGETRQSIALTADNQVVEVFASAETGTWSITVTRPGGPTCLVASGHAYERLAEELPPEGKGA